MKTKNGLITRPDGSKAWYLNGKYHRVDGPAYERPDGHKEWWLNGQLHREDGPAYECSDGSKAWYLNGKRHRVDGPAYERPGGYKEWWFNDESYDKISYYNLMVKKGHMTKTQAFAEMI